MSPYPKGTIYYTPYALFICAKGTILCPPHFYCVSPRISQEGQYIAPFNTFPVIYLKGIIYYPLMHDSLKNGVIRGTI